MNLSKRSISGFPSSPGSGSSNKISLGLLRGKAITTSVPTIKFSTGAEEVVEVFSSFCEEEVATVPNIGSASGSPKHDHARSTTPIDDTILTSTPASDPWRFFSGIKGKITKSVEGKLIEYKNKSATTTPPGISEDNAAASAGGTARSPKHHPGNCNSSAGNSRSDSEDISESSLSKTQGGLSTTEGVEMSSTDEEDDEDDDDGTPSQSQITSETVPAQRDRQAPPTVQTAVVTPTAGGLRYRLRTIRGPSGSTSTETTVGENFLRALQRLAGDNNDCQEVRTEQGVDVLEDMDIDGASGAMEPLDLNIENMSITSDDVIEVREVLGSEIRTSLQADVTKSRHRQNESELANAVSSRTIFNPAQFVDLRHLMCSTKVKSGGTDSLERNYKIRWAISVTLVFLVIYFALAPLSVYFSGFILGVVSTLVVIRMRNKWLELTGGATPHPDINETIIIPNVDASLTDNAVLSESTDSMSVWMNEWPAPYTPQTYTVACTQTVHLRLQRHLLRVSNTNARLPKRDMIKTYNETNINAGAPSYAYTRHRIYDLRGATVTLLPVGLTRIRWWSKKYPICIELASPDQLTTEPAQTEEQTEATAATSVGDRTSNRHQQVLKQTVRKRRKWHQHSSNKDFGQEKTQQPIMFSKLMLDDKDAASMIGSLDLAVPDGLTVSNITEPSENKQQHDIKDEESEDNVDPTKTRIYLFARTCRDKETWYQLLSSATTSLTTESLVSNAIYHNYMDSILNQRFNNSPTTDIDKSDSASEEIGTTGERLVWLNALLGRAWYSYAAGGESATMRLKDRIQRKLATIRLPAFIEELKLSELSIGAPQIGQKVPIQIRRASHPLTDTRGVWVDFDLEYESSVVLILQTKLNLMRLKSKGTVDNEQNGAGVCDVEYKSAIFHSDVDDSAESSSDDDSGGDSDKITHTDAVDSDGAIGSSAGSTAPNQSPNHKLIRMVDRIADSRLFRAATEYRYVQRALENVRNTDLCLRVEVRSISGRVCVNIPPPPSDRLWLGFRATPQPPKLRLRALPTVGDYHISLQHVTGWLERRLTREFHKVLVLPNMEDIVLPGLK